MTDSITTAVADGVAAVSLTTSGLISIAAIMCGFGVVYALLKRG